MAPPRKTPTPPTEAAFRALRAQTTMAPTGTVIDDSDTDVLLAGSVLALILVVSLIAATARVLCSPLWKVLAHAPLRTPFRMTLSARAAYGEMLAGFASTADPIADAAKARLCNVSRSTVLAAVDEEGESESVGRAARSQSFEDWAPHKDLFDVRVWRVPLLALACFDLIGARG